MVPSSPLLSIGLFGLLLAGSAVTAQDNTTATTTVSAPTQAPTACAAGLQLFVARGSTEDPGVGKMGVVAGNITQKVAGSAITAVDYPATITSYFTSVANGTTNLHALITNYAAMCPNSKIGLLGYSQGAQVVLDVVCGTSSLGFTNSTDLDAKYEINIAAIVLFGDPTRSANQTWNVGTVTTRNGLFPRRNNAACDPYSSRIRSWCDSGDRYCDVGTNAAVHGTYFVNYTNAATDFVVGLFTGSSQTPSGTTTTTSSTPSPTNAAGRATAGGPATFAMAAVVAWLTYLLV